LVERVGIGAAERLWDYLAMSPDQPPQLGAVTILRGKAGKASEKGFSARHHYELSSMARVDYEYNATYRGGAHGDEHPVVRILTINYSSH